MEILNDNREKQLRQNFILHFINKNTSVFQEINSPILCSDGYCYLPYLWDTLKNCRVCSEKQLIRGLESKRQFYIMWDIHSKDFIYIENYWKYPKECILKVTYDEFISIKNDLPEDIYFFDDSFEWGYALTHETITGQKRYCVEFFDK